MESGDRDGNMHLFEMLGLLHTRLTVDVNRAMAGAGGLTLARYRMLRFIEAKSPTHARAIRAFFDFSPRTVTEALDGLERDGLIRRARTVADRRKVEINVTRAGRDMLRVSEAPLRDAADRLFGSLTASDMARLDGLLLRLLETCHEG